ncbi:gamma carbonic anhydrase family protein [Kiloniella sp. b19]|uniref:gamma carbonic anhydrase family protein n=1 Tax=Kiloniella sp. GXU_MW_B19 TaxID=3141326 RepID=UPI0031D8EBAC
MAKIIPFCGVMPRISPDAFIAEDAVIIGDVEIGPESSIWFGCVLRGDVNAIRIGRRTNIQDGTVIHVDSDKTGADYRESGGGHPTIIGDDVTVGHMALLHACVLEDRSFVGMRSAAMDRSVVSSGGMLAAGALLTPGKRIPAGQIWSGSPAKLFREMSEAEQAYIKTSADNYWTLAQKYM